MNNIREYAHFIFFCITMLICFVLGLHMYSTQLWNYEPLYFFGCLWFGFWVLGFRNNTGLNRFLILVSVLLFWFGFPPYSGWSMLFAFVPLLVLLDTDVSHNISLKKLFSDVFFTVVGYNVFTTYWVAGSSFFAGIFAFLVNALIMTIPLLLTTCIVRKTRNSYSWFLLIPFWVSYEFFHHNWDLSWPWLTLGNAFSTNVEVIQWYKWTSVFGGSFWIISINVLFVLAIKTVDLKIIIAAISALLIPITTSLILFKQPLDVGKPIKVLAYNPNLEPHFESLQTSNTLRVNKFLTAIQHIDAKDSIDLILAPETFLDGVDLSQLEYNQNIQKLKKISQNSGAYILYGVGGIEYLDQKNNRKSVREYTFDNGKKLYYEVFNNALFYDNKEHLIYNKKKFVPGAEIFPFQNVLRFFEPIVRSVGGTIEGLGSYERDEVFPLAYNVIAGPVICYEADFPAQCRKIVQNGANFLTIISEDGWWGDTAGYKQQFHINRLRSIEHNKYFARASNSGWSGFVDPKGRILNKNEEYQESSYLIGEIYAVDKSTFYTKTGDWLAWGNLIFSAIFSLVFLIKRFFL